MIYLVYFANSKNLDVKEKNIFFEIAIFSSTYLLSRNINSNSYIFTLTILNIPLLITYLKKKENISLVLSIILILLLYFKTGISVILLILEYCLYFIFYCIYKKKNSITINKVFFTFTLIKIFFMSFEVTYYFLSNTELSYLVFEVIFMTVFLLIISYVSLLFFKKSETILDFNSTINELNREKDIKTSLFKISHEIKNPLAVCRGYLDMMSENNYKNYDKYFPIINSEVNRTLFLMDDFLDYTKLKINKEDVDIVYLLEEVEDEFKPLLKKNNVKFLSNIPDDEIYLDLDYNRIKQVLINVFKNSIEASHNDALINLNLIDNKNSITITIEDNGEGMSEETLNKIGEAFYTTKERGTGLGVSLSKEIIKLHGGKMEYESSLGKGTKVFITLPTN
jgi:signal transduction histidine kinase